MYILLAFSLASFHCCVCFNFLQLLSHLRFLKRTYDSTTYHALILPVENNRQAVNYFLALHTTAYQSRRSLLCSLLNSRILFHKTAAKQRFVLASKCIKLLTGEYFCPAVCHHESLSSKNFEIALILAFNNAKNTDLG